MHPLSGGVLIFDKAVVCVASAFSSTVSLCASLGLPAELDALDELDELAVLVVVLVLDCMAL
jgi:hypothetical protein